MAEVARGYFKAPYTAPFHFTDSARVGFRDSTRTPKSSSDNDLILQFEQDVKRSSVSNQWTENYIDTWVRKDIKSFQLDAIPSNTERVNPANALVQKGNKSQSHKSHTL